MEHILKSFAVVTRFTALFNDRSLRLAVSHHVMEASHNGTYGFLAASDDIQKLTQREGVSLQDKMNLYTVRDALKRIHEQLNPSPVEGDYANTPEEYPE
jgi:hypothetical protein